MMKRILAALLLAAPMLAAAPASADGDWYASAHLGKGWKEHADMNFSTSVSVDFPDAMMQPWFDIHSQFGADLSYTSGWGFGAAVGRRFGGNWRAEFDLSWRKSKVGHFMLKDFSIEYEQTGSIPVPNIPPPTLDDMRELINEDTVDMSGKASLLTTAVNLHYDWPVPWRLKPYVGAGLGAIHADKTQGVRMTALTDVCTVADPCVSSSKHKESWDFTWQLMAGLRLPLSELWDATLGWRYANMSNVKFNLLGGDVDSNLGDLDEFLDSGSNSIQLHMGGMHSIELGVIRRF